MEITGLVDRYKKNIDQWRELEDKISGQYDMIAWTQFLGERSKKLRCIYAENADIIRKIHDRMERKLEERSAAQMFDSLMDLYHKAYDDACIFEMIGVSLLKFYNEKRDYGKIVALNSMIAFELIDYERNYTNNKERNSEAAKYFLNVVSLCGHYCEIENRMYRRFFFTAFCNLVSPLTSYSAALRTSMLELYDKAKALWSREDVQALDGNERDFQQLMWKLDENLLAGEEFILECDDKQIGKFFEKTREIVRTKADDDECMRPGGFVQLVTNKDLVYYKKKTGKQVVEEYFAQLKHMSVPDFSDEDYEKTERRILDIYGLANETLFYLQSEEFTAEERNRYVEKFLPDTIRFLNAIPYHFATSTVNEISIRWYENARYVLPEYETKLDFLNKMVIARQPLTYIHSRMVARIASEIAEEMLWKCPELFMQSCGYESIGEVLQNRDKILDYVCNCAMLHDIGKTQIVDVINQQTRPLTDREFALLREHSERGAALLHGDEVFEPYIDVILGHHKTYDGKGGYPADFDNTASSKRILIDLITIADCTDAATDLLGRNYATGKNFYKLLEELEEDAGTRYNPQIVRIISDSKRLKETLDNLTSTGRYSIYYEAYRFIQNTLT